MRSMILALLAASVAALARPIEVPTYEQLLARADVVVILKVQAISETEAKTGQYGSPDFYQGYRAKCEVLSVLKGQLVPQFVAVPFFQHPKAMPGFNGAIAAPFTLRDNLVFLAYLKRYQDGKFAPVTGEYDAGLSIKLMFDIGADIVPVKLPPPGSKPAEPSTAPNPAPPNR